MGILQDRPHRLPLVAKQSPGNPQGEAVLGLYAGGPVRKTSRKNSDKTVSEVSAAFREQTGINYLTEPFKSANNATILKFTKAFFDLAFGRSQKKRAENLLQAIVRNPLLRGDYGSNSASTQSIKGFDRKGIDTGQMFKSITAKCTVK